MGNREKIDPKTMHLRTCIECWPSHLACAWMLAMDCKTELIELLQRRESVIADHAWRDRDPDSHLEALKEISLAISAWPQQHAEALDPKLSHYLANASFAKALAHLQAAGTR